MKVRSCSQLVENLCYGDLTGILDRKMKMSDACCRAASNQKVFH